MQCIPGHTRRYMQVLIFALSKRKHLSESMYQIARRRSDNEIQEDKMDSLNNKLIQIDAKLEKLQAKNQFFHFVYSFCGDVTNVSSNLSSLLNNWNKI